MSMMCSIFCYVLCNLIFLFLSALHNPFSNSSLLPSVACESPTFILWVKLNKCLKLFTTDLSLLWFFTLALAHREKSSQNYHRGTLFLMAYDVCLSTELLPLRTSRKKWEAYWEPGQGYAFMIQ